MRQQITLEEKLEVIDLYFEKGKSIRAIEASTDFSKSTIGRVIKLHKEKYINGNKEYITYPKHYYKKNRKFLKLKRDVTKVLNEEIDLNEREAQLKAELEQLRIDRERLVEKKYNLLNK